METRIAIISIIIENQASVERLNSLLHEYSDCIIGRMGIPYREKNVCIISVAIDAPLNRINTLSGRIGKLDGVSVKTLYNTLPETQ